MMCTARKGDTGWRCSPPTRACSSTSRTSCPSPTGRRGRERRGRRIRGRTANTWRCASKHRGSPMPSNRTQSMMAVLSPGDKYQHVTVHRFTVERRTCATSNEGRVRRCVVACEVRIGHRTQSVHVLFLTCITRKHHHVHKIILPVPLLQINAFCIFGV